MASGAEEVVNSFIRGRMYSRPTIQLPSFSRTSRPPTVSLLTELAHRVRAERLLTSKVRPIVRLCLRHFRLRLFVVVVFRCVVSFLGPTRVSTTGLSCLLPRLPLPNLQVWLAASKSFTWFPWASLAPRRTIYIAPPCFRSQAKGTPSFPTTSTHSRRPSAGPVLNKL